MNKRDLRLEDYGISRKRYKELCGFCEQYPEWKLKIFERTTAKAITYSNTPRSITNHIGRPTEDAAIKLEQYIANCKMIENVAQTADPENWKWLIAGVCGGKSINWLIGVENMPLSKSEFYRRRTRFFILLDKEKN